MCLFLHLAPKSNNELLGVTLPDSLITQTPIMRAIVLEGWKSGTILTGVWVAGAMPAVLLTATTWMYRRQTAWVSCQVVGGPFRLGDPMIVLDAGALKPEILTATATGNKGPISPCCDSLPLTQIRYRLL